MEEALEEYLAFARGQAGEEPGPVDLTALCHEIGENVRREDGADIEIEAEEGLVLEGRAAPLKRAVTNLVQNARAFATRIVLSARRVEDRIEIAVDDNGPGIPPDRRGEAFKPFSRLDESRNANRKGVGLGLAIARDTARAHGGDVRLEDSELGGLRAVMSLPA